VFRASSGEELFLAVPGDETSSLNIYDISDGSQGTSVCACLKPKENDKSLGMIMDTKVFGGATGTLMIVGYEDGTVCLYKVCPSTDCNSTQSQTALIDFSELSRARFHFEPVSCVDYCPTSHSGFTAHADGKMYAWNFDDELQRIVAKEKCDVTSIGDVTKLRVRGDGKLVVAGGVNGYLKLFGGKKLTPLGVVRAHSAGVQCIVFHTDNSFAVGSNDKIISIWSLYVHN